MSSIGKIAGAAVGWLIARWEGAIVGFFLGTVVDSALESSGSGNSEGKVNLGNDAPSYSNDFNFLLLSLSAAVMQSDGVTTRNELEYVKVFLVRQFGVERAKQSLLLLRDMLKRIIPIEKVCAPLRLNMAYQGKLELLHYLFGIANADGNVSVKELNVLNRIAIMLGITASDFSSISAMFSRAAGDVAYKVLGISPEASEEEIKKAYRQKAMESHPDRVGHLGEELRQSAEEKFKKIQAAYEEIKKRRGFS